MPPEWEPALGSERGTRLPRKSCSTQTYGIHHLDRACPDYGSVLDDDAKAFFTAAESFAQPQVSEASSQLVGFDRSTGRSTERSTGRFSAVGDEFLVVVTAVGGTTG